VKLRASDHFAAAGLYITKINRGLQLRKVLDFS
jgi:hypothetical protein